MTTYKTAELSGYLLDLAIAKVEGHEWRMDDSFFPDCPPHVSIRDDNLGPQWELFQPSTCWSEGGHIIDLLRIGLIPQEDSTWLAKVAASDWIVGGTTALEAAMRAYVVAKLGEEVELP